MTWQDAYRILELSNPKTIEEVREAYSIQVKAWHPDRRGEAGEEKMAEINVAYELLRAGTIQHLAALDLVYNGVISDHRKAIREFDELDLVSQDMLIAQTDKLELFQWFVRAHLEDSSGKLSHEGAQTEAEAADAVNQPLA